MCIVIWPILGTGRTCLIDWLSQVKKYYYYYLLPPLRTVFTITYPKQTISVGYVELQLFCRCNFCYVYLLLLLLVITFVHGIYNYVSETQNVCRRHSVVTVHNTCNVIPNDKHFVLSH